MNTLYTLKNLCKRFKMTGGYVEVLRDLNLTVEKGKWLALVGQSGSGKTTLLQLLGGLDRPTSGSILLDGDDIGRMSSSKLTELRRRRIGFIFQSYHLFPELNSLENAVLPALHWGQDRDAAEKFARELLSHFGLAGRLTHRPYELSGGEQQRVAIARALVNNPDIILADEPTGNLDRKAADDIIRIINDVRKDSGKTLVMVTHDQEMANRADAVFNLVPNRKRP